MKDEEKINELRNCTGWRLAWKQKEIWDNALKELTKILMEIIKPKKG